MEFKTNKNMRNTIKQIKEKLILTSIFLLISCSTVPKKAAGIEDACHILKTHQSWELAFRNTFEKYGVPPHVIMAIIYQESRFVSDARPPRGSFLGIPTSRPSTAGGYAQALDTTWDWYKEKTGNSKADRENIVDAIDFVGWYATTTKEQTGVSKWDAKNKYLAYHEGAGGYKRGTYKNKSWLVAVSEKVDRNATRYRAQLDKCYSYAE